MKGPSSYFLTDSPGRGNLGFREHGQLRGDRAEGLEPNRDCRKTPIHASRLRTNRESQVGYFCAFGISHRDREAIFLTISARLSSPTPPNHVPWQSGEFAGAKPVSARIPRFARIRRALNLSVLDIEKAKQPVSAMSQKFSGGHELDAHMPAHLALDRLSFRSQLSV